MSHPFRAFMFTDNLVSPTVIDATAGGRFDLDIIPARFTPHSRIAHPVVDNCWTVVVSGTQLPSAKVATFLGPTLIVKSNKPVTINWANKTRARGEQSPPPIKMVRPILTMNHDRWLAPNGVSMHLHGGKVFGHSDGWPLDELPPGKIHTGKYPNKQAANLIWYHGHAMEWTARNVYAGLAGSYIIRDQYDNKLMQLIDPDNEITLTLQDRQLWDTDAAALSAIMRYEIDARPPAPGHEALTRAVPYGIDSKGHTGQLDVFPECLGEFNLVNGILWPKYRLRGRDLYRLRLLNGSNARTYALKLLARVNGEWRFLSHLMTVIGTDGGFMGEAIPLPDNDALIVAPGERRDIILDLRKFSSEVVEGFSFLYVVNVASVPFSSNDASVPNSSNLLVSGLTPDSILTRAKTVETAAFSAQLQGFPQVMRFDVDMRTAAQSHTDFMSLKLPTLLVQARAGNAEFKYSNAMGWKPKPSVPFGPNRVFLIDNATTAVTVNEQHVGMMYLRECHQVAAKTKADVVVNMHVDTQCLVNPPAAQLSKTLVNYQFDHRMNNALDDSFEEPLITDAPKPGTYERWYLLNLEAYDAQPGDPRPDMHPLHIHLVNFYVSRLWRATDSAGKPVTPKSTTKHLTLMANSGWYAKLGLRDTLRIAGNHIVEIIVYFPIGYSQTSEPFPSAVNRFTFYCHILEHQDRGMMRYFEYG